MQEHGDWVQDMVLHVAANPRQEKNRLQTYLELLTWRSTLRLEELVHSAPSSKTEYIK